MGGEEEGEESLPIVHFPLEAQESGYVTLTVWPGMQGVPMQGMVFCFSASAFVMPSNEVTKAFFLDVILKILLLISLIVADIC